MTFTSPCGVIPSLMPVNPLTSQNSTVITRRCPSAASTGRSTSPSTPRGSIYLPKVSRIILEAQLLDHAIEGRRQMADLVPRRGDKRFVEVACLDGARTFQQSPDRACHAGADQH